MSRIHSKKTFDLLSLLRQKKTVPEQTEEQALISSVDKQKNLLDSFDSQKIFPNLGKLQSARFRISKSLRQSEEEQHRWQKAQNVLFLWLENDKDLFLQDLLTLNSVLRGKSMVEWRTGPVFTSCAHPPASDLAMLLKVFEEDILRQKTHPLLQASEVRQWILSVHPFDDANGRTSQICSDYILIRAGYLPQSFFVKAEGLLIADPGRQKPVTPHRAFIMFGNSVFNSYDLLMRT